MLGCTELDYCATRRLQTTVVRNLSLPTHQTRPCPPVPRRAGGIHTSGAPCRRPGSALAMWRPCDRTCEKSRRPAGGTGHRSRFLGRSANGLGCGRRRARTFRRSPRVLSCPLNSRGRVGVARNRRTRAATNPLPPPAADPNAIAVSATATTGYNRTRNSQK